MEQRPFEAGAMQMSEDLEGRVLEVYEKAAIGFVNFPQTSLMAAIIGFNEILKQEDPYKIQELCQSIPVEIIDLLRTKQIRLMKRMVCAAPKQAKKLNP